MSGNGTLEPVVDEAGIYTMIITDTDNQCKDTASIQITVDQVDPEAFAGPDALLGCWSPTLFLDGTNSTTHYSGSSVRSSSADSLTSASETEPYQLRFH